MRSPRLSKAILPKLYRSMVSYMRTTYHLLVCRHETLPVTTRLKVQLIAAEACEQPALAQRLEVKANKNGVPFWETNLLRNGVPGDKAADDMLLVLYAQHLALKQGYPESDFRKEVLGRYNNSILTQTEKQVYGIIIRALWHRLLTGPLNKAKEGQTFTLKETFTHHTKTGIF